MYVLQVLQGGGGMGQTVRTAISHQCMAYGRAHTTRYGMLMRHGQDVVCAMPMDHVWCGSTALAHVCRGSGSRLNLAERRSTEGYPEVQLLGSRLTEAPRASSTYNNYHYAWSMDGMYRKIVDS